MLAKCKLSCEAYRSYHPCLEDILDASECKIQQLETSWCIPEDMASYPTGVLPDNVRRWRAREPLLY